MRWISETIFQRAQSDRWHGPSSLIQSGPSTASQICVSREQNELHLNNGGKRGNYQRVPDDIRKALAFHAYKYGVKAAVNWGNKKQFENGS